MLQAQQIIRKLELDLEIFISTTSLPDQNNFGDDDFATSSHSPLGSHHSGTRPPLPDLYDSRHTNSSNRPQNGHADNSLRMSNDKYSSHTSKRDYQRSHLQVASHATVLENEKKTLRLDLIAADLLPFEDGRRIECRIR